jgi:hypothetical protein
MAYKVNKYNGVEIATVQDGTTDNSTDLTFIGKNYAGYGEVQNENFLHLLENFANTEDKPPTRPVEGQIWYDSTNRVLKFHDGYRFKSSAVSYGSEMPTNSSLGDLWWDSTQNKLYSYIGVGGTRNGFLAVGPDNNTSHTSLQAITVTDGTGTGSAHDIVEILANGVVVAIFNSDDAFVMAEGQPIDANDTNAFPQIKKGITLRHTDVTGVSFKETAEWQFWGTASDASSLGGTSAEYYAKTTGDTFTGVMNFSNSLVIGTAESKLTISEDDSNNTLFSKTGSNQIKFIVDNLTNLVISTAAVSPNTNTTLNTGTIDLGTTTAKWKNMYASGNITAGSFTGVLIGNAKDTDGAVILDNTAGSVSFKGNIKATDASVLIDIANKKLIGNIQAFDGTAAYDYNSKTFTGSLTGTATSASKIVGTLSTVDGDAATNTYPPATQASKLTVVVRDADGNINGNIVGNCDNAKKLLLGSTYVSSAVANTVNTIAARNGDGDIAARVFDGIATKAYYADLAEKYVADAEYETGTVVIVGGDAEVTACSPGGYAIGVVSENPAYMMNSGLENGTYIALKGRVPTKVVGAVNKGDRMISGIDGCATANNSTANHCFGIALESSSDISVKMIEVLVL